MNNNSIKKYIFVFNFSYYIIIGIILDDYSASVSEWNFIKTFVGLFIVTCEPRITLISENCYIYIYIDLDLFLIYIPI